MFAHPNEQISRIIRIVPVGANQTVLLQLERPVQLTEFVNPICLASWYITFQIQLNISTKYFKNRNLLRPLFKKNECVAVGRNGTLLASAASFKSLMMNDRKTTTVTWANNETIACSSVISCDQLFTCFVKTKNKVYNIILENLDGQCNVLIGKRLVRRRSF